MSLNWTAEMRDVTVGRGEAPYLPAGPVRGLASPRLQQARLRRGDRSGQTAGREEADMRILMLPIVISVGHPSPTPEALVLAAASDLQRAWRGTEGDDEELNLNIADWPTDAGLTFFGRPMGVHDLDIDLSDVGAATCMLQFDALDPWGYGVEVDGDVEASSPFTVELDGMADIDRFVVTIVGNDNPVLLTSTTDQGRFIALSVLATGETAVLDFRARTVEVNGDDAFSRVQPGSLWFELLVGTNNLTFSGCASVQVSHRPAMI